MGHLKFISDSRILSIISKGPKYRLPSPVDFNKCGEEIAVANEFCKRWCRRENVEYNALDSKKLCIFNIIENLSFYSNNLNLLPPKPKLKLSFRHLKQGIQ